MLILCVLMLCGCVTRRKMYEVREHWGFYGYLAGTWDQAERCRGDDPQRIAEEYFEWLKTLR